MTPQLLVLRELIGRDHLVMLNAEAEVVRRGGTRRSVRLGAGFSGMAKASSAICAARSPMAWKPNWNPASTRSIAILFSGACWY